MLIRCCQSRQLRNMKSVRPSVHFRWKRVVQFRGVKWNFSVRNNRKIGFCLWRFKLSYRLCRKSFGIKRCECGSLEAGRNVDLQWVHIINFQSRKPHQAFRDYSIIYIYKTTLFLWTTHFIIFSKRSRLYFSGRNNIVNLLWIFFEIERGCMSVNHGHSSLAVGVHRPQMWQNKSNDYDT